MAIDITNAICIIQQKEAALTCTDDSTEIIKLLNAIKLTKDQVIRSYASVNCLPTASSDNEGAIHLVRDTDYLYASDGTQWNVVNDIPTVLTGAGTVSVSGTYPSFTITGNGINLTDLSVSTNSASGSGALAYDNTTGVFAFTPPNIASCFTNNSITDLTMTGTLCGPATFTIDPAAHGDNTGTVVIAGNLQVDGTTTTVNSCTLEIVDKNIVLSCGATNSAASDGAGITVDLGSDGNSSFTYNNTNNNWQLDKGINITTGAYTINNDNIILLSKKEPINIIATAAASYNIDAIDQQVIHITADATSNWTTNVRANASTTLDSILAVGQSMTFVVLATQGATAYYNNVLQVDGVTQTPKWGGGSAPTAGNVNSVDSYSYTVIKTAANTYTVLANKILFA